MHISFVLPPFLAEKKSLLKTFCAFNRKRNNTFTNTHTLSFGHTYVILILSLLTNDMLYTNHDIIYPFFSRSPSLSIYVLHPLFPQFLNIIFFRCTLQSESVIYIYQQKYDEKKNNRELVYLILLETAVSGPSFLFIWNHLWYYEIRYFPLV